MSEKPAVYRPSKKQLPGVIEDIEPGQSLILTCMTEEQRTILLKVRYEGVGSLDESEGQVLDDLIRSISLPAFEVYHEEPDDTQETIAIFKAAAEEHQKRKAKKLTNKNVGFS